MAVQIQNKVKVWGIHNVYDGTALCNAAHSTNWVKQGGIIYLIMIACF